MGSPVEMETRFEEPASVEEARDRVSTLTQRVAELQARIGTINEEKPPAYEQTTHADWQNRRQRTIAAWRNAMTELRYVKAWMHNRLEELSIDHEVSASQHLFRLRGMIIALERLYALVGAMVNDEGGEQTYADVCAHYEFMKKKWAPSAGGGEESE